MTSGRLLAASKSRRCFVLSLNLSAASFLVGLLWLSVFQFADRAVDGQFDTAPSRIEPAEGRIELGSVGKRLAAHLTSPKMIAQ